MNELVPFGSSNKSISNWEKPGGKFGMVVAGLLGAGGLMLLYKALPFMITMAQNVITLGILCAVIAGVLFLITNKDFRRFISVGYFVLMRKLVGFVIELDPIAIVKRRVLMLKKKMSEIQTLLGKLNGSIKEMERKLNERTKEFKQKVQEVKVYNEQGGDKKLNAQMVERQVVRLQDLIGTYQNNLTQSKKWFEILTKLYQMSELTVADTEAEVEIRSEQFEQMKKQHNTFKGIMSVVKGDPDEIALFTEAMDFMARDISEKLGEMEFVIESAGGLMDQYETGKIISSRQANEIIAKYDEHGIDGLFQSFGENKMLPSAVSGIPKLSINKLEAIEVEYIDQPKSKFFN